MESKKGNNPEKKAEKKPSEEEKKAKSSGASKVGNGSRVTLEYKGTLDDGTMFDTCEGGEPFQFEVGAGQVIKGFEEGVIGMSAGEQRQIKILAKDAYGERNDMFVQPIPKEMVKLDREIAPGMVLGIQSPDGRKIPVKVSKVDDKNIYLDMNHPLAGKNLNFKIKVISIS